MSLANANTVAVLDAVAVERARQDAKWGEQGHPPAVWLAILGEEYGEAAKPVADHGTGAKPMDWVQYREELVHVAAVAVAAVEALDFGASGR